MRLADQTEQQRNRPLTGLVVVEFGDDIAVRYCGHLFAKLGASVFRRDRASGDEARGYGGRAGVAYGRWLDAGKIEGRLPQAQSDLVIGGLDESALTAANAFAQASAGDPPVLALTWFDSQGPYAGWAASDEVIGALNGVAYTFGEAAGPPMLAQGHSYQVTAGLTAFNAALAALLAPVEGRPSRIDVNVFEASMTFSETAALTGRALGGPAQRLGVNRFVPTYPCSPYQTADGWVGVTCLTPAQWRAMCSLIDREDLTRDPRFATTYDRLMIGDEVDAILAPAFLLKTTEAWIELAIANRIPMTPMVRPGLLPQVAHWKGRDAFEAFGVDGVQGPTLPYQMSFDGVASPPRPGTTKDDGPLSGVRVVDFSMGWAGPLCSRTLGDLGADVIKIESGGHPDWWRGWEVTGDAAALETRHNFIAVNRNKRGVSLDLTTLEGLAGAKALVASADVVVENYAAGVLSKLGLGPQVQQALRPGIISVSMPAFGNGGPLSGLRAYGSTVEQASGLPFLNGAAHWPPAQQHIAFGDPIAGLYAASAVLAALAARDRLGGAQIDLAQVACLFQLAADGIIAEQVMDGPAPRTGLSRQRLDFCAVVAAAGLDAWLLVVAEGAADRAALSQVIGGQGESDLSAWAASRTALEAATTLQAAGVMAAQVNAPHTLCGDPQLLASGFWAEMQRAYVGAHLTGEAPLRFDGARPALRRTAPVLGEHTHEVMSALELG